MIQATAERRSVASTAQKTWPLVEGHRWWGCMGDVQRRPMELYHNAWREHGDYVRLRALPGIYFYLLAHPDAIEYVLQHNHKNYRKPDSFNHSIDLLTGQGVINSEGELWRRQRRLMQPAFLKASVNRLAPFMNQAIAAFIAEWTAHPDGASLDVLPEMMRLALKIASTTLMGTDISNDADAIGRAYRLAFEYVSLKMNARLMFQPLWLPTHRNREFRRAKRLLDRVVLELIAARRGGEAKNDVLDRLLAARDEETGQSMSDEQIKDEAITLLTAGHETIGASLAWALYLLSIHPEIQEAFCEQARRQLGNRVPTVEDLPQIPLATAVFEETMRLYPPAWGMPRETIEADVINGYPVPAKATLITSQFIIHRHPDFWSEPDKFDPDRFLPGQAAERHRYAYFPFGGGPRICIGNHMAMLEGPMVLAALASRFRFTLVDGQRIEADPTFTLRPKYGVQVVLRKRST